jgi:prepilin-type N-terminal cleavage/methylation domain-containing protein
MNSSRNRSSQRRQAFTLIELLIVIAIIAILSVVVILTLNPAQLLEQSRDSNRLSDLSVMNTAIGAYIIDQNSASGFSLGSSSVTYVSVPDPTATTTAGTDCTGIGFTSGGYFHCAASSTFRNTDGTGWLPINFQKMSTGAPFGQLPVDPTNQTSSSLYYSYVTNGTQFKLQADPESQNYASQVGANPNMFSSGSNLALNGGSWVMVPGNSTFGTSNFYVMQYDAVCSNGAGTYINTPADIGNGYNNATTPCASTNSREIASLSGGYPVVDINQTTAASYCAQIGGQLLTNNQWQTIAWNAEGQNSNWSGGTVGSGNMPWGNASSSAAQPEGVGQYGTGYTGNFTYLRTLTLSNGSVVWDMAGNVWQWTNNTIIGTNEPNAGAGGFNWHDFTQLTTYGSMTQQTVGPLKSTWNSSQNIGEIYSKGQTDATIYGFMRGDYGGDGSTVGIEAIALNSIPGNSYDFTGFRCSR